MSHSEYKTGEECMEALRKLSNSAEGVCQHAINYVYELEQRIAELEAQVEALELAAGERIAERIRLEQEVARLHSLARNAIDLALIDKQP